VIHGLETVIDQSARFETLIKYLYSFVEATFNDFDLFLTEKTRDKLIETFDSEKYVFADKIRSILERISTGIFSVPIAFVGALFAIRDISQEWLLYGIFAVLAIFTDFTAGIDLMMFLDLGILRAEITKKIKHTSMGIENLKKELNEIMKPFCIRITLLRIFIIIAIVIFIGLFISLVVIFKSKVTIWKIIII
jgi:hypothetical protein